MLITQKKKINNRYVLEISFKKKTENKFNNNQRVRSINNLMNIFAVKQ